MSRALSTYLDLLRFSAALWVFTAHAALLVPATGLPEFWWTAEDAVMGFFVLSGFVISYTSAQAHAGLRDYFAARLARLYSVAVPALLFAVLVNEVGRVVAPGLEQGWTSVAGPRLVIGLLFLNELWFGSARMPANVPYWSIGYEFWYYVLFGFAFYLRGRARVAAVGLAALVAGPKILLLAPVWLMGVWAHRMAGRVRPETGWLLFAGSIFAYLAAYLLEVRPGLEWRARLAVPDGVNLAWSTEFFWKYLVGAMAAANIVGFAAIAPSVSLRAVERPVRWLAGMTFSIYLFHWPMLVVVLLITAAWGLDPGLDGGLDTGLAGGLEGGPAAAPGAAWPAWFTLAILAAVLTAIAGLAELSERRKALVRQAIDAALAQLGLGGAAARKEPGRTG